MCLRQATARKPVRAATCSENNMQGENRETEVAGLTETTKICKCFQLSINNTKRKYLFPIHCPYEKKWKIQSDDMMSKDSKVMEEIIGEQKCHYQVPQEQPPQTPAQKNTVADPALNGIREQLTVHTCQSRSDFFPCSITICLFYYHVYQV